MTSEVRARHTQANLRRLSDILRRNFFAIRLTFRQSVALTPDGQLTFDLCVLHEPRRYTFAGSPAGNLRARPLKPKPLEASTTAKAVADALARDPVFLADTGNLTAEAQEPSSLDDRLRRWA